MAVKMPGAEYKRFLTDTILWGFFLVLYVLGSLNAIDFRLCVGELGACVPKQQSLKSGD